MLQAVTKGNALHHGIGLPLTSLGIFSLRSQDEMMRDAIRLATRTREMSRTDLSQLIRNLHRPDQGRTQEHRKQATVLAANRNHKRKKDLPTTGNLGLFLSISCSPAKGFATSSPCICKYRAPLSQNLATPCLCFAMHAGGRRPVEPEAEAARKAGLPPFTHGIRACGHDDCRSEAS
jgi:hypothetical protein